MKYNKNTKMEFFVYLHYFFSSLNFYSIQLTYESILSKWLIYK